MSEHTVVMLVLAALVAGLHDHAAAVKLGPALGMPAGLLLAYFV